MLACKIRHKAYIYMDGFARPCDGRRWDGSKNVLRCIMKAYSVLWPDGVRLQNGQKHHGSL